MGTSKALLEVEGETFVHRVVRALVDGGCDPVVVVVATGDTVVADAAAAAGATVIGNPEPGEGPITSLRLAIEHIDGEKGGLAYLPVDHPMVSAATVALLLESARASGSPLTVPMHGPKRGHPAIFASSLFPELIDPDLEGGARVVVHRHLAGAKLVAVADPGVIADIDTPEAYRAVAGREP